MSKLQPEIVLSDKPYQMISWFSNDKNWNKEIGALCVGKCEEGNVHISELLFPEQTVSMASVQFTPEGWAKLISEADEEKIQNIIGYWHKHPGSTALSGHDETETVDVFMTPESGRKLFCFIVSAWKSYAKEIDIEGRIELRGDINASVDAEITYTTNDTVGEECKKILKEKVTEPDYTDIPTPIRAEQPTILNCGKTKEEDVMSQVNLDEYTEKELQLDITKTKNEWEIQSGEAFVDNFYQDMVTARQNGAIKSLYMKPNKDGTYVINFTTEDGHNKKLKKLLYTIQQEFTKEREKKANTKQTQITTYRNPDYTIDTKLNKLNESGTAPYWD